MLIIIQISEVEVNVVTIKETLLRWKWWPMWKWWWCYLFGFLSFATDAVLRRWKLNHAVIFNWKPMMTVESCHQRWQGGLRGGWIWSWCWTHHWRCEARITRPDQARPNTGSLHAQHLFHSSHRRQLCAMNPCIGCFADRYWSDYLFSLTPPGV